MVRSNTKKLVYLLIIVSLFLVFFFQPRFFSAVKFKIIQISSGPIKFFSAPVTEIKKLLFYHRTFEEYIRLRSEVEVLRAKLLGFEEVHKENIRLEKLLDLKRRSVHSSVTASVIGREPSNWNAAVLIDKGERDGVKAGFPVVNAFGVVGKIAEVGEKTSKVILLTDPQFSVAARVQRTRDDVLVSGTLQDLCVLKYLEKTSELRIGDKVVTSKLSSSFPVDFVVGEIIEIKDSGNDKTYFVKPAVSLSQVEEVLIILYGDDQ